MKTILKFAAVAAFVFTAGAAQADTVTVMSDDLSVVTGKNKFPISGRPVSDESFRQILKTPYSKMPPFGHLTDEQVNALLDYLKTL